MCAQRTTLQRGEPASDARDLRSEAEARARRDGAGRGLRFRRTASSTRLKVDLAGLYNLAQARTADVFGKRNISVIATVNFDYARALAGEAKAAAGPAAARGNGEATRKPERASDYMRDPPPTMNPQ